jgi:hypothetical protein
MPKHYSDRGYEVKWSESLAAAIAPSPYALAMRTKSLPQQRLDVTRALLKRLIKDRYAGVVLRASDHWGVSQSLLNDFLNEKKGLGLNSMTLISAATGIPFEQISGAVAYREGDGHLATAFDRACDALRIMHPGGETEEAIRRLSRHAGAEQIVEEWLNDLLRERKAVVRDGTQSARLILESDTEVDAPPLAIEEDETPRLPRATPKSVTRRR